MCNGTKVPCSFAALSKGELWCARDASRLKAVQHNALLRAFAGEGAHDTSAGSLDSCLSRKLDAQWLGMTEGSGKGLRRAAVARTAECGYPHTIQARRAAVRIPFPGRRHHEKQVLRCAQDDKSKK